MEEVKKVVKKVYIIYKPGCGWSEKALSILRAYQTQYPGKIEIYVLPTRVSKTVSIFCDNCGICGDKTFPQIWVGAYDKSAKQISSNVHSLADCTGYIGGCQDLMKIMSDLNFNWPAVEENVIIKWGLVKSYWPSLTFDPVFENFFRLDPVLYYLG